jgi:hypothetical protein
MDRINEEDLVQYNWFSDHAFGKNEVVIMDSPQKGRYLVFLTDEECRPLEITEFMEETPALVRFLDLLREQRKELLLAALGEEKQAYYLKKFERKPDKYFTSFNLSALLIYQLWLFYRKMYGEAILVQVVVLLASLLSMALLTLLIADQMALLAVASLVAILVDIVARIVITIFGDSLYLRKIYRLYRNSLKQNALSQLTYLKKRGGTNKPLIIVFCLIAFIALVLFMLWLTPQISLYVDKIMGA